MPRGVLSLSSALSLILAWWLRVRGGLGGQRPGATDERGCTRKGR